MKRIAPGPGQESVWDYPRPPKLEKANRRVRVVFAGETVADAPWVWRVLETSHPPVYYIDPQFLRLAFLRPVEHRSVCEWKGQAGYFDVRVGDRAAQRAAWFYPEPLPAFVPMKDCVAFYAGAMDFCTVDCEAVTPQPGGFYGGWITRDIVGPFKGGPGTWGW